MSKWHTEYLEYMETDPALSEWKKLHTAGNVDLQLEEWKRLGEPHIWRTIETAKGYEAQYDIGRGLIRLMHGALEIARGSGSYPICGDMQTHVVIMLHKEYFGVNKCLWF